MLGTPWSGWQLLQVTHGVPSLPERLSQQSLYHPNHPDGNYETANRVQLFDPPSTISWETGYDPGDGTLRFGGWFWRYDLTPAGPSTTTVTLSYDWSACPDSVRELIGFPPFPPEHLGNSLAHLAELVTV
jgi:hypothetical protein